MSETEVSETEADTMAAALPVLSVAPGGSDSDAPVATPHVSEAAPSTAPANRQAVVLFACRKNAGRSQLSEALFNHYADPALARGISAGSEPIDHVYPEVPVVLQVGAWLGLLRAALLLRAAATPAHPHSQQYHQM